MKMSALIFTVVLSLSNFAHAELARFLPGDKDALQARTDLIEQAKNEILLEYFSITDDGISTGAFALLCEASKRGVHVYLMMDALSSHVKKSTMAAVHESCRDKNNRLNFEIRLFNPLDLTDLQKAMNRDHGKMLIADGKTLIIGGRNVDKKYFGLDRKRNFKDLDILINGNVVKEAQKYFKELWNRKQDVKEPDLDIYLADNPMQNCPDGITNEICQKMVEAKYTKAREEVAHSKARMARLLREMKSGNGRAKLNTGTNWLDGAKEVDGVKMLSNSTSHEVNEQNHKISDDLYSIVNKAKKNVLILSPYLIPNARVKKLFKDLLKRKVSITIITNSLKSTDNLFAQAGYQDSKKEMINMGIELYEFNQVDTTHAKTAVVDDETVLIGTFNIDPRSSRINREVGLVIDDTNRSGLADELTDIINNFRSQSLLVGKNGKEMNIELQNQGVSKEKIAAVEVIRKAIPYIKDEL